MTKDSWDRECVVCSYKWLENSEGTMCPSCSTNHSRELTEDEAWAAFVAAAKVYANWLDQWEKVRFGTEHGTVYLSINRSEQFPDSFNPV